jgi:DNA repair exonuclease SbcCD ATPase subunit
MKAHLREVEVLTGVTWPDRAAQAERELAAVREECAALRTEAATLRREHDLVTKEMAAAREKRDRYERALKAFARFAAPDSELAAADADEWIVETVAALLDGQEAECPVCSTHVHEGACVGDGGDEDSEDDEPQLCDACGDTRGTCIHL